MLCDGVATDGCTGTVGFAGCGGKVGVVVVFGTSVGVDRVGIAFTGVVADVVTVSTVACGVK